MCLWAEVVRVEFLVHRVPVVPGVPMGVAQGVPQVRRGKAVVEAEAEAGVVCSWQETI